jgi:hypothetical protein
MGAQEVRWAKDGTVENDNKNHQKVTGLKICKGIVSLKTVCFYDMRSSNTKRSLV